MIQPVADKRIIGSIGGAGEGGRLLGKVVTTTTVMFLVTIAMITAATWLTLSFRSSSFPIRDNIGEVTKMVKSIPEKKRTYF